MTNIINSLPSTTFGGRKFQRQQLATIQRTVHLFSRLSRRELGHTICELFQWKTPTGADRIQSCLNALEEMEACGLIQLPAAKMIHRKKSKQKELTWTSRTDALPPIQDVIQALMPLRIHVVKGADEISEWNEFVDRYHYLGYRRPIGSHLRYYVMDCQGRKLGCLLFSFATTRLTCRDEWIGWKKLHRQKHLNLVIKNTRFLVFPWVEVKHLASKALAYTIKQLATDWQATHGYQPILVETFVDPQKYTGTCYKAANWQYIGDTKTKKNVYIHPLHLDAREILTDNKQSLVKKVDPYKSANISSENTDVHLWQKIMLTVSQVAEDFDQQWQKRKRILSTLLVILFIFRLVFSKNKQGYGATITELWEYCHKYHITLPQEKPPVPAAFCQARQKLDESVFQQLNSKIINVYQEEKEESCWKGHPVFAVDGSKINLPKELETLGYKKPSKNCYYPQGLVSCLYQLKSQLPYHFEFSKHADERLLAHEHLKMLHNNDLVIYDRGYFSYALLYAHVQKNIHAVFRLPSSTYKIIKDFIKSEKMEEIVTIIPRPDERKKILKKYPNIEFRQISLRLVKYKIENTIYTLGTTLTDATQYDRKALSELYHERWGIEELYKISKVLIDIEDFHAKTERGVKQELFAHFVIVTLSRIFANHTNDVLLLKKDIIKSNRVMKTNMKNCLLTLARNMESLLLQKVAYVQESVRMVVRSIANCYQAVRLNRSYQRISHKIVKKWHSSNKATVHQSANA